MLFIRTLLPWHFVAGVIPVDSLTNRSWLQSCLETGPGPVYPALTEHLVLLSLMLQPQL